MPGGASWGGALDQKVYSVKVTFKIGLSTCQFGWGMRNTTGGEDISEGLRDAIHPWITTNFRPLLQSWDQLVSLDVVNPATKTGYSHDFANAPGTNSGAGAAAMPSMLAAVVSMKSGVRQRLGQGRFYLPVRNDGMIDGDLLSSGGVTQLQAFVTAFAAEYIGLNPVIGARLANFHEALPERPRTGANPNGLPPLPAVGRMYYDVESLRLNTTVTALKSRKAGVGS